jgi:enoyl-CoA hydratase
MVDVSLRHVEERGVHTLTLDRGANALDREFMEEIHQKIRLLRESGAPPMVLASSHPTLFCPGWDLKRLAAADRSEVAETLASFDALILELFSYPGATAAAVAGHAVAAGCQLAIACDTRVMAGGRPRLGFAELNLGVPVPAGPLLMLRAKLNPAAVEEVVLRGDGCSADRARELGLVQRVVPFADVGATADREVRKLASKSRCAYGTTKEFLYSECWSQMRQAASDDAASFLDCWFEAETSQRIADVAKGLGEQ